VRGGRYLVPEAPGYSAEMRAESLAEFAFPGGPAWSS
jgi:L-fuconate dehydratase